MALAEFMSKAQLVPQHLQGKAADCLLVIEQAVRWGLSPFAVAQATSVIKGKLMFEGKLVIGVVNARGGLEERLAFTYDGEGSTRHVVVSGRFTGEKEPRTVDVFLKDVRTSNEMWIKQPDQQLAYSGARIWARRFAPELMLGVYTPEEDVDGEDNVPLKELAVMPTPKAFQPEVPPALSTTATSAKPSAPVAAKPTGDDPKAPVATAVDPRDADVAPLPPVTATFETPHDPVTGEVTDAEFTEESDEEDLTDTVPVHSFNQQTQQWECNIRNEPKLSPRQLKYIQVLRGKIGHHLDSKVTDGVGVSRKIKNIKDGKYYKVLFELTGKEHTNELSRREATLMTDRLVGMWERLDKKLDRGSDV